MNPQVLHDYIIRPTLEHLGDKYNTKVARKLLLATCAQESHCGVYFKQVKGPALGIYQMEPITIRDLFNNSIAHNKTLKVKIAEFQSPAAEKNPEFFSIIGNTFYATAVARANYYRFREGLPAADDIDGIWKYYKKYWNSTLGAATKLQFMNNYERFVDGVDFGD